MNFDSFKKLYDLALEKYRKTKINSMGLSKQQQMEEFKKNNLELISAYTDYVKSQDTPMDKKFARYAVKLLQTMTTDVFINRATISKYNSEKSAIKADPVQWVLDQYEMIMGDLEPYIDCLPGSEEEIKQRFDSSTKNAEMLKKYELHVTETQEKIRYMMHLLINESDDHEQEALLHAIYDLVRIMQDLTFDCLLQFSNTKIKMDPSYENILKNFFSDNKEGKTLHVVNVFDGDGDFVHMKRWFGAYENLYPGKSHVILVFRNAFHNEQQIQDMIDALPADHVLKNIGDDQISIVDSENINIELKRKIFGEQRISNLTDPSEFNALYGISFLNPNLLAQLSNYATIGLRCCMIHEVGSETQDMPYTSLTFGVADRKPYCGCFFDKYDDIKNESEILSLLSDNLQKMLFGENYQQMTVEEKLKELQDLDIIAGYYQKQRNTYPLEHVVRNKIKDGRKTKLIITGQEVLPEELKSMNDKYSGPNFSVDCCKFNAYDYKALMCLLQSNDRHLIFASGDDTLQTCLSIGKPILFLNRDQEHKDPVRESKGQYINHFIELLRNIRVELKNTNNTKEADLLSQIIQYTGLSLMYTEDPRVKVMIPSPEAMAFFKNQIVPYIKQNFDLDKNIVQIIDFVEHDKKPLKFNVEPFKLKKTEKPKIKKKL